MIRQVTQDASNIIHIGEEWQQVQRADSNIKPVVQWIEKSLDIHHGKRWLHILDVLRGSMEEP